MAEGSARLVSLDLQPMAPLRNTTTLQADITIPSTIPLVLSHLRTAGASSSSTDIQKADLVICDGAPDVTGVHDLDAYLHYQLLLAAITLTLTILRKGGTAVYKVFLSPMDPKGEMLRSQLAPLFGDAGEEVLLDLDAAESRDAPYGAAEDERRQKGVWICKPRSSRAGSGGKHLELLLAGGILGVDRKPRTHLWRPALTIRGILGLSRIHSLFGPTTRDLLSRSSRGTGAADDGYHHA